jgi:hypothetical protein
MSKIARFNLLFEQNFVRANRILLLIIMSLLATKGFAYAANTSSANYTLVDPELQTVSGEASSTNYKALFSAGAQGISYGKIDSSLYSYSNGQAYTFMANVPKISCFETSTLSGESQCTGIPNGMVSICGIPGCYDRAVVQIDTQNNPTDTVYILEISPDNFSTSYIISGTTRTLKPINAKDSSDYLTKAQWESSPWQTISVLGLKPNTQYSVRARALQGNYTETPAGPSKVATTAVTSASLDLDIATDFLTENNSPYSLNIGVLSPESATILTTPYIKIDFSTNAQQGASLYVKDSFSGLKSSATGYILTSDTEDLSLPSSGDGFGLQFVNKTQDNTSSGYTTAGESFLQTNDIVGQVSSTVLKEVACIRTSVVTNCSSGTATWVNNASILLTVGARASLVAPSQSDYTDILTFSLIGGF